MATKYGASFTDIINEMSDAGALSAFGGKENLGVAMKLAQALSPQPEPVDPALLSFLFFSKMAEESSKPGSTALGAAGTAAATPAAYLMQKRKEERKAQSALPSTALSLAKLMKPDTGSVTYRPATAEELKKYNATAGQMDSAGRFYDLSNQSATKFSARTLYKDGAEKKVYSQIDLDKAIQNGWSDIKPASSTETKFTARTVYKDNEEKKVYSLKDYNEAITTGGWSDVKDTSSKDTFKTVGSGTLAKYMTEEDAKNFVVGLGLPETNENFTRIVKTLTAANEDQIGQAISDAGVFLEIVPLVKGDEIVNLQFTPSKTAAAPYFTTYVQKRLPLIAKSVDTYNTTAREVLPRIDEALALLKSGKVETGKLAQTLLPFKQIFNQAFGINDPEDMGLETLQATSNFLAPKMRPVGSGSTSDMEFRAYQQAALYLGNTPQANYISLYAFKKMAENGVKLNQLEQELLTSNKYTSMQQVNKQLNNFDSGIFEKFTGDPTDDDAITEFYDSLPEGAVIINNGIFNSSSPYVIKGWGS